MFSPKKQYIEEIVFIQCIAKIFELKLENEATTKLCVQYYNMITLV